MTYAFKDRPKINFSELDDKFWIDDGDTVRWFDSPLDATDAAREVEIKQIVASEVAQIAAYFRRMNMEQCAVAIETGAYKRGQ